MSRSHTRVVTVRRNDREGVVAALAAAPPADLVEVRLDALWNAPPDEDQAVEDLLAITDATTQRLLATLRPVRQGGAFDGPEEIRINLLLAAAKCGFAAVDLEDDNPNISSIMGPFRDGGVILSDHRMQETPSREVGMRILQSMQDAKATYDKLAFPATTFADGLRALELTHSHAHRTGHPAIAPIGGDAMLRALLAVAGNHATYGHDGSGPVVPGQPALADIESIWANWGLARDALPGDPDAGWLAVLGHPVEHSLSPRIHNAMLREHGLAQRYGALDVPDSIGAMRLVITVADRIGLRGASVTMPLKQHALAVTTPDATAQAVGAANCIRFTANGPISTNTDATAMRRLLDGHDSVAIIGAGGAARAAIWAALDLDLPTVFTCRDAAAGQALAAETGAEYVAWTQRDTIHADAWVQATPIADDVIVAPNGRTLIELVYKAGATALAAAASSAGLKVIDGEAFLIEQALDAYRFWTGKDGDAAVMAAALSRPVEVTS